MWLGVASLLLTQRARVRSPVGSISWVRFFRDFSSPLRQMSGSLRPTRSPNIIWPSQSSFHTSLFRMNGCMNGVHRLSCSCCLGGGPGIQLVTRPGGPPCSCVVKKVGIRSSVNSLSRQFLAL